MLNIYCIWRIALNEAKLLFRSWGFRIFSLLGLIILTLLTVGIGTTVISTPYFLSSLSGSLPLATIKLFNIYQGIIAAFLATEFFKRDRRHDSNQVVLASSFSNMEYFLGKVVGILSVFALLNAAVLLITFVIHFFFSGTIFAWQPYILYTLLISLPTLIFLIGLAFLLSALLRSQAVA
ncbi:MAG: xanthan lyase, partial [Candidatus Aminicenantes bacterium]|nr:xanthan lyase [Candidatus Aminicenantes bacterium]